MRSLLHILLLTLTCVIAAPAAFSQTAPATAQADLSAAPDYDAWRSFAQEVEATLDMRGVPSETLSSLRADLVGFRSRFLAAQDANQTRIATVREQLAALGPPPEEGASEAAEIAARRAELSEQLSALQAPGIAAQEAFRRADGLIRQIDTILRERDAEALMTLWPSPVNPVNWVAAADAIWGTTFTFVTQVIGATEDPARILEFRSNVPIILLLLIVAGFVLLRGRRWIERGVSRLMEETGARRGRRVFGLLASLAQVIVPVTAVIAISIALDFTALLGDIGSNMASMLIDAGLAYFIARWAGRQVFPLAEAPDNPLKLSSARRREGRVMSDLAGLYMAIYILVTAYLDPELQSDAANAVIAFPILVFGGIVLFRLGALLSAHRRNVLADGAELRFYDRTVGILGKASMGLGALGPVLAAIGYVQAAEAMLDQTLVTLGLIAILLFLVQLVNAIHDAITGRSPDDPDALIPALITFVLVVMSLPLIALIWGLRVDELLEFWQVLREGFRIGETRIAPGNIISFAIVFAIGYGFTRVLQGALGGTVLPKTRIDKGGQKAIISGTGYVGIFIAALVAISTAGIDLSGLAIVAGALSVGIGFGLQNIVSNFISGLILLIERPVAEGDWIEVGGNMGTVRSISVRSTVIETFDRTDVVVPNADLISGTVTNWTRYNKLGRLTIKVGVAYGTNTRNVERILREIGEAQPLAVLDPRPTVIFMGFGADALEFELRVVISDVSLSMAVRTEIHHQIAERFLAEGIEIPFAQRDIWLRNPEALRGEDKARPEPEPVRKGPELRAPNDPTEGMTLPVESGSE